MKKIFTFLSIFAFAVNLFAADDCNVELQQMTDISSPIEFWGENYQACLYYEWTIVFPEGWNFVEFDYTIDLNPGGAIDAVMIFTQDETGQEREVLNYSYRPTTGKITIPLHSSYVRVVFISEYGNAGGLYNGFKLSYRMTSSSHVFYTNVGIGTHPNYELDVAGTIRANEIIVNTTGADFVFADDYQLRPLSEVKTFIQENKHLPEIKSAQEMHENGVGINELQTQLLQKIEELTLYILQQEERIKALEAELNK